MTTSACARRTIATVAVILVVSGAIAAQSNPTWSVAVNGMGQISAMTINDPVTHLRIEQEISIDVNYEMLPQSGTVKFRDGVRRALTDEEVRGYWNDLGGDRAAWDYLQAQGRLMSITPGSSALPADDVGKMTRVILNDGHMFYGRIVRVNDSPAWFIIDITGKWVTFFNTAVKEIQQVKR